MPEERRWLREAIETGRYRAPADPIDPVALLDRLTDVEAFERFLHRTFPGKTRFSIEGLDMLVPILDEVISEAAEAGLRQAFIGMAHRGRLNVMAHVLGKPYEQILAEFKDPIRHALAVEGVQWAGDVKYHLGASRAIAGGEEVDLVVSMPPNPSHLEAIDPVLEGMARAAGTDASRPGAPVFDPDAVLPILIHGDAAFPGQGVVAETLNLHRLDGYSTGGTIHIIANNQIGFTTDARRLVQHALCERPGARIQDSDRPRQRGRSGGVRRRRAARVRVPRDVQARRPDRSRRLPALRPQRGRRARVHAAGRCTARSPTHPTVAPDLGDDARGARRDRGRARRRRCSTRSWTRCSAALETLEPEKHLVEPTPEIAAPGTAAQARARRCRSSGCAR